MLRNQHPSWFGSRRAGSAANAKSESARDNRTASSSSTGVETSAFRSGVIVGVKVDGPGTETVAVDGAALGRFLRE